VAASVGWQAAENEAALVAVEGDEVTVSFVVKTEAGDVRYAFEETLLSVYRAAGRAWS